MKGIIKRIAVFLCVFAVATGQMSAVFAEETGETTTVTSEDKWDEYQEQYSKKSAALESEQERLSAAQTVRSEKQQAKESTENAVTEVEELFNDYTNRLTLYETAKDRNEELLGYLEEANGYLTRDASALEEQTAVYEDALETEESLRSSIEAQDAVIAQKEQECSEALAQFRRGSRGFFEHVGNERALAIMDSDIAAQWNHEGDPADATALDLMKRSIELQMEIEEIRNGTYGLAEMGITDELMASAQVRANRVLATKGNPEYDTDPTAMHVNYFGVGDYPGELYIPKEEYHLWANEFQGEVSYPWFQEKPTYDLLCRRLGLDLSPEERVKCASYEYLFTPQSEEYEYYKDLSNKIYQENVAYQDENGIPNDSRRLAYLTTLHYVNLLSVRLKNNGMAITGELGTGSHTLCMTKENFSKGDLLPNVEAQYYNDINQMGNLGDAYTNDEYLQRFLEYYNPLKEAIKPYEDAVNQEKEFEKQLEEAEKTTAKEKAKWEKAKQVTALSQQSVDYYQGALDEWSTTLTQRQSSYETFVAEHGVITEGSVNDAITAKDTAAREYEEALEAEREIIDTVSELNAETERLRVITGPHADSDPQYVSGYLQEYTWNDDCTSAEMSWTREDGKVIQTRQSASITSESDEYNITYTAHFVMMGREFTSTKVMNIQEIPKNIVGTAVTYEPNDSPLVAYLYPTSLDMEAVVDDIWDNNAGQALLYECEVVKVGRYEGGRTLWRYSIKDVEPGTYSVALYKSGHVVNVIFAVTMENAIVDVDANEYEMQGETENAYVQYSQIFGSGTQVMRMYGDYDNNGEINLKDVLRARHDFSSGAWEETPAFIRGDMSCSFTNRLNTKIADIRGLVAFINGESSVVDQYYR